MKRMGKLLMGAVAVGALVVPTGAQAALSDCEDTRMCVWGNTDYVWKIADRASGNSTWVDPFTGDENDEADSFANKSGTYTGCLAQHVGGDGDRVTMSRGQREANLAFWNDNEASSIRTKNGC